MLRKLFLDQSNAICTLKRPQRHLLHYDCCDRLVLRLGSLGRYVAPFLTLQVKPSLGFDPAELQPIRGIAGVRCPLLLIAGSEDTRTPLAESKRMFDAAPEPKELWVVTGAGHVNFHRFAGSQYEERVLSFLSRSLKVGGG